MLRINRLVLTVAATLATAALVTPAAQAKPVTGQQSNAAAIAKAVHRTHRDIATVPSLRISREIVHDAPLANPVEPKIVTGRIVDTSGGIDWTFPVMGAIAVVLIMMIAGDQLIVRRRGQLAT
jgi:hypothetical protein